MCGFINYTFGRHDEVQNLPLSIAAGYEHPILLSVESEPGMERDENQASSGFWYSLEAGRSMAR